MRSAWAEACFRALSPVEAKSAGVSAHLGRPADERSRRLARESGLSLDQHLAQPVNSTLVQAADAIFVMDALNEVALLTAYPQASEKVFRLGRFAPRGLSRAEIADPFHGSEDDVRACHATVSECVRELVRAMEPLGS